MYCVFHTVPIEDMHCRIHSNGTRDFFIRHDGERNANRFITWAVDQLRAILTK